jgi:hypothetical protein
METDEDLDSLIAEQSKSKNLPSWWGKDSARPQEMKSPNQSGKNKSRAQQRRQIVLAGGCGHCGKTRGNLKFLCDDCAKKHRDRQKAKYRKRG